MDLCFSQDPLHTLELECDQESILKCLEMVNYSNLTLQKQEGASGSPLVLHTPTWDVTGR